MRQIILSLFFSFWVTSAYAGSITIFTDRSAFDAAVTAEAIEDFGQTPFEIFTDSWDGLQHGATYNLLGTQPWGVDVGFQATGFEGGFLDTSRGSGSESEIMITYDISQIGVGFDTTRAMDFDGNPPAFDITLNFLSAPSINLGFDLVNSNDLQFFGFKSNMRDIVSVVINGQTPSSNLAFAIDNHSFSVVPLPPAALLFSCQLLEC